MKIEISTDIYASAETAWAVMSDIEQWPQWTASVERAALLDTPSLALSSRARLLQPGLPETVWRVTRIEPGRSFTWEAKVRGTHVWAGHRIEPTVEGCRVTLTVSVTGVAVVLLWPLVRRQVRGNMQLEADGLRRASEQRERVAPLDWAAAAA